MKELPKIEEIINPAKEDRQVYNLLMSFKTTAQATLTLAARDENHAKELAMEQATEAGYTDPKVHDIYLMSDIVSKQRKAVEEYNRMLSGDYSDDNVVEVKAKELN